MIMDREEAMARRGNSTRPAGLVIGSMVAITFGTVFVLVNSAELSGPWRLGVRVAGPVVAALLVAGLVYVVGTAATVGPVAGVGSGAALYATVGVGLRHAYAVRGPRRRAEP